MDEDVAAAALETVEEWRKVVRMIRNLAKDNVNGSSLEVRQALRTIYLASDEALSRLSESSTPD